MSAFDDALAAANTAIMDSMASDYEFSGIPITGIFENRPIETEAGYGLQPVLTVPSDQAGLLNRGMIGIIAGVAYAVKYVHDPEEGFCDVELNRA